MPVERPIFVTGPPAHRDDRAAPAAARGPERPGAGDVADPVAAAAAAAGDAGTPTRSHAMLAGLRAAPRENPELAWASTTWTADTVEECWRLLRQSCSRPPTSRLAHVPSYTAWLREARTGRRLRAAPAEPAADRAQRPRQALGAEEPVAPDRARRADDSLPRRTGRPDPPRPGRRRRFGVLAGGDHVERLVDGLPGSAARGRRPRPAGDRGAVLRGGAVGVRPGAVHRRRVRRLGERSGWRRTPDLHRLRPAVGRHRRVRRTCRSRRLRRPVPGHRGTSTLSRTTGSPRTRSAPPSRPARLRGRSSLVLVAAALRFVWVRESGRGSCRCRCRGCRTGAGSRSAVMAG